MSQLSALIWLKWKLFRNSLRSRKALVNRAASVLGTLAALGLALFFAVLLGVLGWALADVEGSLALEQRVFSASVALTFIYLMWAIVPVSTGSGREFDPERLLLYPISLGKLFAVDYLSDLTSLASIFGVPMVFAFALGAGVGSGHVLLSLPVALLAVAFGLSLSKLVTSALGALLKGRRTRGENLVALVSMVAAFSGIILSQLISYFTQHDRTSLYGLRWTPPGVVSIALLSGLTRGGLYAYALALLTLALYTFVLVLLTYRIARRSALGLGGAKRRAVKARGDVEQEKYAGWHLPFVSAALSAVIEKEARYVMRNAQLRLLVVMPLTLVGLRLLPVGGRQRGLRGVPPELGLPLSSFASYSEGLFAALGILYVFVMLGSLACNLFAYEGAGMRSLVLSPIDRRDILLGKNIVLITLATVSALLLLIVNQLILGDLTFGALAFALLCLPVFASIYALSGNWLSMHFPKPMKFGKRMNVSGVTGLLVLPLLVVMALPPLLAIGAGYLAQSLVVKYVTLSAFAVVAVALYRQLITTQGGELARREQEILEAVNKEG